MEKLKIIAEVKLSEKTGPEKAQAIKNIFIKAGLIVKTDGLEIIIYEKLNYAG